MKFVSTRAVCPAVDIATALEEGLAADGGLYVPDAPPRFDTSAFRDAGTLAVVAGHVLAPYFAGHALEARLPSIVASTFSIPAPLVLEPGLSPHVAVLELFHGPTAAFKDFGARFLATCLAPTTADRPATLLVATSGDTGAAAAAAFHGVPGVRVVILYPHGRVSSLQERQLTCWTGNVRSYAVEGSFDDCQRLVKQAFGSDHLRASLRLWSANSINIGRLLAQMSYYAYASLQAQRLWNVPARFIVPTGNLGNALSCVWAREAGFPIGEIVFACNANRVLPDYFATGAWQPHAAVTTLANAMDIGNPSNIERLVGPDPARSRRPPRVSAVGVDDDAIRARVLADYRRCGRVWCPHTATAAEAWRRAVDAGHDAPTVIVATAHPAKFPEVMDAAVRAGAVTPPALATLGTQPVRRAVLAPEFDALVRELIS